MININDVEDDVRDLLLFCKMNVADVNWHYSTDQKGTTLFINFLGQGKIIQLPEGFWGTIESIRQKHKISIEVSNN